MKRVMVDGLEFDTRENTSDLKAIKEVVIKKGYKRKDFFPQDGEHWIDIGANIGAFAVWAGSLGAQVEAFEPDPESAELAKHNVKLNGLSRLVTIHNVALTEKNTSQNATLYTNTAKGNVWRNSLYKEWRGGGEITVKTQPVEEYWKPGSCIKLDAEGAEIPILQKYSHLMVRKLVFEWSFDIDPDINKFRNVINELQKNYSTVKYNKFQDGYEKWQSSWFPPCRTVWCY